MEEEEGQRRTKEGGGGERWGVDVIMVASYYSWNNDNN